MPPLFRILGTTGGCLTGIVLLMSGCLGFFALSSAADTALGPVLVSVAGVALLVLVVMVVRSSVIHYRRLSLIHEGRCPSCGYDLRATPDRCPECGGRPYDE